MQEIQLDPWQINFLKTKGDKILYTGRQVGKSVICGKDAGEWAANNSNKVVLMIAPTERQAYALFEKTLNHLIDNYPKMLMRGKYRPTKSKITLKNKTIIWCLPTGLRGLGIRFLTVHRLYADEAARIPEEVWTAVTPMLLTTGGDSIYLTTPFGTETEAHNCFVNKDHAYDSFTRFSCDSETVMRERKICETWTEKMRDKALQRLKIERARMTELEYAQEYLGRPMVDLKRVFSDKLLKEILVLKRPNSINPDYMDYFLGQDIAGQGKDESTWEILDGTDAEDVKQVESIVKKKLRTPARVNLTIELEKKYEFNKIGVDDGGLGSGDFDYLLKEIGRKVVSLNNASRKLDKDGIKKKKLLKEEMYNNLLAMMEMGEIQLLDDNAIYYSLSSIQFEIIKGKAKYSGNNTHIAEGLIRAAWCIKDKSLNIYIY